MIKNFFVFLLVLSITVFAQGIETVSILEYYQQNPSKDRQVILEELVDQFKDKSVNQEQINSLWNNHELRKKHKLMRFQIINQQLYADSFDISHLYFVNLFQYFQILVTKYKIKDVDFVIHARDELTEEVSAPSFMMSKNLLNPDEATRFLMPDAYMLSKNWANLVQEIKNARDKHDWQEKKEKIFWRGATTGSKAKYPYNINNIDKLARIKLVLLSKLYPEYIDAKFNRFPDFSNDEAGNNLKKILNLLFGKKNDFVKESDHLDYKYLIAIDGNTCPWQRIPWIMLSNSILIKQETSNVQWFYKALEAYKNYVPVKEDLSNIFTQIDWLKKHDQQAKQISLNAQQFIENNLLLEDIDKQMVITLNEYSKIQTDAKIIPSITLAEDVMSIKAVARLLLKRAKLYLIGE